MPVSNYPNAGMKDEARKGIAWREEFGRGGTRVGAVRARQIIAGENLSDDTVKRMFSFFSRQEGVKKAEGFKQGEEGYPSNGRIAWALWGGDAGFSWSRKLVEKMKKEKSMTKNKEVKRHIEEVIETDDSYTVKFLKADSYEEEETEEVTEEETEEITIENSEVLEESRIETKEEKTVEHRAAFPMEFERDEVENRTITMSVSSESPVMREFGLEILSHRTGDVDLNRLNNKAPLLLDHDSRQQIGVIENTRLDESQGRLYSTVRFGKSTMAREVFDDVLDGIRTQVSIGYTITNLERESYYDDEEEEAYRAAFTPHEVSIVSMGADQTVGIGRSLSLQPQTITKETIMEKTTEENKVEVNIEEKIRVASTEAVQKREKDISEIYSLASRHNKTPMADEAVAKGLSLDAFRGALLQEIENKPLETNEIGLNETESRSFSIVRAAKAQAGLISREDAAFELEAAEAYAQKLGRESKGFFVPEDVTNKWSERTLSTAGSGANVVYNDLRYQDMIGALTPFSTVLRANPTILANNTGNVSIPRTTATQTSNWIGEGVAVASSDPTLDSVTLSEHTNGCFTDMTRSLLQNTDGFSVEQMVRNNLLRAMGTAWDAASVAGNPAAVAASPRGIEFTAGVNATAFGVAGAPTYAELIAMESAIFADNASLDGNSVYWITTPALNGYMKSLATNGAGSPVAQRDGFVDGREVLISSQVTNNTIILGDFSEFIVATWAGLEIQSDPYALATSGGLRLIALSSVDFGVKHPVSFCVSA